MSKKRTRLEIMHDILVVVKSRNGKIKPTHILYKSNLSYQMMDEYLKFLIEQSFLIEKKLKRGKTYEITQKGREFLQKYSMITEFTTSFGLD
jgi:predicted transcriptional regulator